MNPQTHSGSLPTPDLSLMPGEGKDRSEESNLARMRERAVSLRRAMFRVIDRDDEPTDIERGRHLLAEAMQKRGRQEPLQSNMNSANDLLELGAIVLPRFDAVIQRVADITRGEVILPGLKSRERIDQKANGEFRETDLYNALRDVVRGSIVFDRLEDLYRAVEQLYGLVKIVHVEDRFLSPSPSGYSDMKLYLEFDVPGHGPFLTELQLHISPMVTAKKAETRLYVRRRELEDRLKNELDPSEKLKLEKLILELRAQGEAMYENAATSYHQRTGHPEAHAPTNVEI